MKLLLQHRILLGYIILIVVIGSMAAIMFHERNRVQDIESEMTEIRDANRTINAAHRHITVLATLGESAITWDKKDYRCLLYTSPSPRDISGSRMPSSA